MSAPERSASVERLIGLDAMRYLALLFVVLLHTPNVGRLGELIDFVGRFAVPFFFVSSGYLLARRRGTAWSAIAKSSVRILIPFIVWDLVYVLWSGDRWATIATPAYLTALVTTGAHAFHLWFLPSLWVSTVALILLKDRLGLKPMIILAGLLYAAGLALGPYEHAFASYPDTIMSTRDGLLFSLPLMMAGFAVARAEVRPSWAAAAALFVAGLAVAAAEWEVFRLLHRAIQTDYLLGVFGLGLGAFLLALRLPEAGPVRALARLGRYGLGVYCIHLLVLQALERQVTITKSWQEAALAVSVLALSTLACAAIASIRPLRSLVE